MTNARQFGLEAHACSQLEGVLEGMGDPMVPPEKSVDSRTLHEADCPHMTVINENTKNINSSCDDDMFFWACVDLSFLSGPQSHSSVTLAGGWPGALASKIQ